MLIHIENKVAGFIKPLYISLNRTHRDKKWDTYTADESNQTFANHTQKK